MSRYADRIQGTDRLLRIRRIRKAVFAGIIALTLVLIFARLDAEGAGIKPLFLPVNGIIEICLIMGFVSAIIGLFLRHLEIKNAPREGQRYLMAKSSMARASRTAGFAIGLAVVLLLAVTPSLAATLFPDALFNRSIPAFPVRRDGDVVVDRPPSGPRSDEIREPLRGRELGRGRARLRRDPAGVEFGARARP